MTAGETGFPGAAPHGYIATGTTEESLGCMRTSEVNESAVNDDVMKRKLQNIKKEVLVPYEKSEPISTEETIRREVAGCVEHFSQLLANLPNLNALGQHQLIEHMNLRVQKLRPKVQEQVRMFMANRLTFHYHQNVRENNMTAKVVPWNGYHLETMSDNISKTFPQTYDEPTPSLETFQFYQKSQVGTSSSHYGFSKPSTSEVFMPCVTYSEEPPCKRHKPSQIPFQHVEQNHASTSYSIQDQAAPIPSPSVPSVSQGIMASKLKNLKAELIEPHEATVPIASDESARIEATGCIEHFHDLLLNIPNLKAQDQRMLLEHMNLSIEKLSPEAQNEVRSFMRKQLPLINAFHVNKVLPPEAPATSPAMVELNKWINRWFLFVAAVPAVKDDKTRQELIEKIGFMFNVLNSQPKVKKAVLEKIQGYENANTHLKEEILKEEALLKLLETPNNLA